MTPHPRLSPLVLLTLSAACSVEAAGSPSVPRANRRSVLLVVVDTLRADHLGCYGYSRPTSPTLDAIAREGAVFERVVSSSSFTGPSVASIHTGRYPRFNSFGLANGSFLLAPEEDTLAEAFAGAGYRTGAVICNPVLPARYGFGQGFESYDERTGQRERVRSAPERTAGPGTDAALQWLEGLKADEDFFLWVHYMDPHGPYTPPADLEAAFAPEDPRAGVEIQPPAGKDKNYGLGYVPWYQAIGERHYLEEYIGRYDAEIASFDREFARLVAWLREQGRYEETVILITADHGEALGEEGFYFCHGQGVTPDQSFVPMILKHPLIQAGTRTKTPVGHVDVFPTLAAEVGVRSKGTGSGPELDLVAAATETAGVRPLYCEIAGYLGVYLDHSLLVVQPGTDLSQPFDAVTGVPPLRFRRLGAPGLDVDLTTQGTLLGYARAYLEGSGTAPQPVEGDHGDFHRVLHALGYTGD
ncbi:MAG: sulfatase [Planctomycetota bacterium]